MGGTYSNKRIWALSLLGLGLWPSIATADNAFFDLGLTPTYDSNVSRAELSNNVEDDFFLGFNAAAGYNVEINDNSGLVLQGTLLLNGYDQFGDLSNISLVGSGAYRFQPRRGFTAPWFEVNFDVAPVQYNDSRIRDGIILSPGATAGKRFTDRISAVAGYRYNERIAYHGEVFDNSENMLFLNLDYDLTNAITLYGTYTFRTGDVVSTSVPTAKIIAAASAIEADNAFGPGPPAAAPPPPGPPGPPGPPAPPGTTPGGTQRFAYRLDGTTNEGKLGINFGITRSAAIDVSARYWDVGADLNNDYHGFVVEASFLYQFE